MAAGVVKAADGTAPILDEDEIVTGDGEAPHRHWRQVGRAPSVDPIAAPDLANLMRMMAGIEIVMGGEALGAVVEKRGTGDWCDGLVHRHGSPGG